MSFEPYTEPLFAQNLPRGTDNPRPKKRRRVIADRETSSDTVILPEVKESEKIASFDAAWRSDHAASETHEDSTIVSLRQMIHGLSSYPEAHRLPGKYLAIDCEMVGIAGDPSKNNSTLRDKGDESSLARVSIVNYYGFVILDVFVRQRERVTDWRTAVSGVRESDMVNAKPFSEVQKIVADLLKSRILVGHAVSNDLKVLLLSHPHTMTRDTQLLAGRHGTLSTLKNHEEPESGTEPIKIKRNKKPALRKLVSEELGIQIQAGEHSSVTDARATMALYRLHRKIWDKGVTFPMQIQVAFKSKLESEMPHTADPNEFSSKSKSKRKGNEDEDVGIEDVHIHRTKIRPSKKQAISSGLSVVVKSRTGMRGEEVKQVVNRTRGVKGSGARRSGGDGGSDTTKWWGTLGK